MNKEQQEKARDIANYYGLEEQIGQATEEMAELIVELHKLKRNLSTEKRDYYSLRVAEETADVRIILKQVEHLIDLKGVIDMEVDKKLDRQLKRIKKAQEAATSTGQ